MEKDWKFLLIRGLQIFLLLGVILTILPQIYSELLPAKKIHMIIVYSTLIILTETEGDIAWLGGLVEHEGITECLTPITGLQYQLLRPSVFYTSLTI